MEETINTVEKAQKLVSVILNHYDDNPNCEHCKTLFKEVFTE